MANGVRDKLLWLERNSLWVLLPLLFLVFGFALGVIALSDAGGCTGLALQHSYDPYLLAAIAGSGFVSGHLLGYLRRWLHNDPSPYHRGVTTEPWLQALLVVFLAIATGALLYESYGTFPTSPAEAITQYVRCAAASNLWLTGATSYLVFLLMGSWLWYPTAGPLPHLTVRNEANTGGDAPTNELIGTPSKSRLRAPKEELS